MTIERKSAGQPAPRLDLSGSEWKLYVTVMLGLAYTAIWITAMTQADAGGALPDELGVTATSPASDGFTAAPVQSARPAPAAPVGASPVQTSRRANRYRIRTRSS